MKGELKCPNCGSSQTRYRVKTKDRYCYVCGTSFKPDNLDELKEENTE